jgi:hypothetical protein
MSARTFCIAIYMPIAVIMSGASFISCELLIRTGARTFSVVSKSRLWNDDYGTTTADGRLNLKVLLQYNPEVPGIMGNVALVLSRPLAKSYIRKFCSSEYGNKATFPAITQRLD